MPVVTASIEKTIRDLLEIGPRAPGSWPELAAAEYVAGRLQALGYDAALERFASASHQAASSRLTVDGVAESYPSLPTQFASAGDVTGEVVFLGRASAPRVDPGAVSGRIGLFFAGDSHAVAIPYLVGLQERGLRGLVVISAQMDGIETKAVRYPELSLPVAAVSWRTGNALLRRQGARARLVVTAVEAPRQGESQNVVAALPGSGEAVLVVSAHHDSAAFAPGALDNASGTAVLLEVARILAGRRFPATVLFVSTGSEENGGNDGCGAGAKDFYARRPDVAARMVAHVEIDDVGNLAGIPRLTYAGNRAFRETAFSAPIREAFRLDLSTAAGCDHGVALGLGLPYIFVCDAGLTPRPCYHTPDDRAEFLDTARCAWHVPHVVGMIERLAAAAPFYPYLRHDDRLIRPFRFADAKGIAAVTEAAFGPYCMARLQEEYFGMALAGKPWHVHKAGSVLAGFRARPLDVVVCEIGDRVVGYASAGYDEAAGIAQIGNNAVHPDFQGRGIGSALQREIARRMDAEGYRRFTVVTMTHDLPAQHVYEKLGYEKVGGSVVYLKKRG